MLIMPRWLLIVLWGILILTIIDGGYLVYLSSYSINEYQQAHNETQQYHQKLDGPVLSFLIEFLDTIELFIERHEKSLIVLSTVAIAAFTATLWRATTGLFDMAKRQAVDMQQSLNIAKHAAKAAQDSADGIVNANTAHIIPEINTISGIFMLRPPGTRFRPCVSYTFRNVGKSPANIVSFSDYFIILDRLPDNPIYPPVAGDSDRDMVIADGQQSRILPCCLVTDTASWQPQEMTQEEMRTQRKPFFLIGNVVYDDVFGLRHFKRYCFRFEMRHDSIWFRPDGGRPYNLRSKEKSPYT